MPAYFLPARAPRRSEARLSTRLMGAVLGLVALLLAGCGSGADSPEAPDAALESVTTDDLTAHVRTLSSDEFEGRAPASEGETKTVNYLIEQFEAMGLEPGNDTSFVQEVPLVSISLTNTPAITVTGSSSERSYAYSDQFMATTERTDPTVPLDASNMVFVGYGIDAPEYDWNDYEGLDVAGKTVVILVNDPGFATQDSSLFKGNAMTYYGRWTYKYEEAARQGAAAALIVHETEPAGYPWEVVSGSWSGPQFSLVRPADSPQPLAVEGWLTRDATVSIFEQAGLSYDDLKAQAQERGFEPVDLGLAASTQLETTSERSVSRNVMAQRIGTERPDEYVIYTAHWDHLGRDTTLTGDQIYNGALDNATGVGGLLELAEAFSTVESERSVLFLAVGVEEQGLLGSAYYAQNPVHPLSQTAAVINMDGLNVLGPMNDITVIGYGQSELDNYVERIAASQDRTVRPDPEPEKGFYFRSDHFSFAKEGVPALYVDAGIDHVGHGEEWTRERRAEYTSEHYHKVSDEYDSSWDLSGAVDDLQLIFRVGYQIANESDFPEWSPDSPFRAERQEMMAGAQ